MWNCFEIMKTNLKLKEPAEGEGAAVPLVSAISEEMYLLANHIVALGEALSQACEPHMSPSLSEHLQLFDTLCQRALTQARLLRGVEALLTGHIPDIAVYLHALIEEVPFEQDRQRLRRAIGGLVNTTAGKEAGRSGDLDWF